MDLIRGTGSDIAKGEALEAELDQFISRRDAQRRQTEGERALESVLAVAERGAWVRALPVVRGKGLLRGRPAGGGRGGEVAVRGRGNVRGRLERLEASAPTSPKPPSRDLLNLRAILDELAELKASSAPGFRGGVPIVPEDIPGKVLGPDHTHDELCGLAVRRALRARGEPASEVARYVEALRVLGGRGDT